MRITGWSNALVQDFRSGRLVPAPATLAMTSAALDLVAAYEASQILAANYAADMRHIALATIATVDALVSWNFKHIVRLDKIRLFNAVNVESGISH